jgi:copper homeostasis protein (lipoprotein)
VLLAVGCAQQPIVEPKPAEPEKPAQLPALPATYVNTPGCPGCLGVTVTLRPDGSYLVREQVGASEFYDFGRWRYADGVLELVGGRDAPRHYVLRGEALDSKGDTHGGDLTRAPQVEALRGPFRLLGVYDGATFKECRTGLAWTLSDNRLAQTLKEEFAKRGGAPSFVSLDGRFDGSPEVFVLQRPPAFLTAAGCPG